MDFLLLPTPRFRRPLLVEVRVEARRRRRRRRRLLLLRVERLTVTRLFFDVDPTEPPPTCFLKVDFAGILSWYENGS